MKVKSMKYNILKVYLLTFMVIFIVDSLFFFNIYYRINQLNEIYKVNIELNSLNNNIKILDDNLYIFLTTRSSDALEDYYKYQGKCNSLISSITEKNKNDSVYFLNIAIKNLFNNYSILTDKAVEFKRGRNISRYNSYFNKSRKIIEFMNANINRLNKELFTENSNKYNEVRNDISSLLKYNFILFISLIIVLSMYMLFMSEKVTDSIKKLSYIANNVSKGNINETFPIMNDNTEVRLLSMACNEMLKNINIYVDERNEYLIKERELKEKQLSMINDLNEAKLKYLQAQINPHFLFNSLNAGAQLAMLEGADRTYEFIQKMADFFRYNLVNIGKKSTLRQEVELVNNYIYILNVRFSGEITYILNVDDSTLDTPMPSMILQPFIENCVNHGIRELEGDGVIWLNCKRSKGYIVVEIVDNGKGFDNSIIDSILNETYENKEKNINKAGSGIGIVNCVKRLRSFYKKYNIIEIGNNNEVGAYIKIVIPEDFKFV